MIGWFMVLSFVLGFALMWFATVRTVTRTATPLATRPDPDRVVVEPDPDTEPLVTVASRRPADVPRWKDEDDELLFDEG